MPGKILKFFEIAYQNITWDELEQTLTRLKGKQENLMNWVEWRRSNWSWAEVGVQVAGKNVQSVIKCLPRSNRLHCGIHSIIVQGNGRTTGLKKESRYKIAFGHRDNVLQAYDGPFGGFYWKMNSWETVWFSKNIEVVQIKSLLWDIYVRRLRRM